MAAPMANQLTAVLNGRVNNLGKLALKLITSKQCSYAVCQKVRFMCYEARKVDILAGKQTFMFDTHAVVSGLTRNGFTQEQAESITDCLAQIISTSSEQQNKLMVTKAQQEILLQQVMAQIAAVKKDMIILEKSEFSTLKHENEKQRLEITNLKQLLKDDLEKVKAGVMLDVNLERSRAKESHAENERRLGQLDNKIDKEVATLIAKFEGYRNDMFKYAAGAVLSCLGISLGFYRIWAK